eukprot:CAMPEP_0178435282 /NCGR_PEP_ID=MMETSP0689_2-20121128/33851_1 /TAXON_ID=160604 /ORGANISM="Amphidinium massartii, Strain CS-259" /LENGTH=316 /DNA_ID=CAMNT_0020057357 /DNA_START=82 /DNA_END=1028 /DNA_ORIENTATION=+
MTILSRPLLASAVASALACTASHVTFSAVAQPRADAGVQTGQRSEKFLSARGEASASGVTMAAAGGIVAVGALTVAAARSASSRKSRSGLCGATVVPVEASYTTFREALVACHAQGDNEEVAPVSEMDAAIEGLEKIAKQVTAGAAAAVVFMGSMAESAEAYPIFAQQNYKEPIEANGKIACANCHLRGKPIEVRMPHEVLPDTIFKIVMEVPANYEKKQPGADGEMAPMNVGGIIIMPEGWKLAPKDRLPKPLKKEMKGLAWSAWSKEKPNVLVAGPIPNSYAPKMVAPVLAPTPGKEINFGKFAFNFGGNRGRG